MPLECAKSLAAAPSRLETLIHFCQCSASRAVSALSRSVGGTWIGAALDEGPYRGSTSITHRAVQWSDPALINSVRVGAGPNEPGNDHGLLVGIPHRRAWPAVNGIVKRFCTTPVPRTNVCAPKDQLLCNARLLPGAPIRSAPWSSRLVRCAVFGKPQAVPAGGMNLM